MSKSITKEDARYIKLLKEFDNEVVKRWGHHVPPALFPCTEIMQDFLDGDEDTIDAIDYTLHPIIYSMRKAVQETINNNAQMRELQDWIINTLKGANKHE